MKIKDWETIKNRILFFEYRLPLVYTCFVYIILSIFIITLLWICFAEMDQTVKAAGVLRLKTNTSIGKPAYSGTVKSKNFKSGSKIKKRDILLILETADIEEDKINTENEIHRLQKEMNNLFLYEKAVHSDKNNIPVEQVIAKARAEIYFAKKEKLRIFYEEAKEDYAHEKKLPSSMKTKKSLRSLLDKFKIAELEYKTFSAQEIINIKNEKNLLTQKLESAKKTLTRLTKEITESKIISPLNGTVEELMRINEGDYIFAGTEILRIIPDTIEDLKAELIISDKDIAELKTGMEVNLKFTALPPSEYGVLKGIITNISNDSFNKQNTPSFFLIDVDIFSSSLKNNDHEEVKLKPGMSIEAHIIIKRKTIIKFILEKLDFIK
ncbi:MAG: HlyD family efflux transporter periplasmic adaptor subunit [Treponema sp.]